MTEIVAATVVCSLCHWRTCWMWRGWLWRRFAQCQSLSIWCCGQSVLMR